MKAFVATISILLVDVSVSARSPTKILFPKQNKSRMSVTGYGAVSAKLTHFADNPALLTGCYGGITMNNRLLIGAGGYGLTTNIFAPNEQVNGQRLRWEMNYFGLILQTISHPKNAVHLIGGLLAGGGYVRRNALDKDAPSAGTEELSWSHNFFYAVEPSLGVEVNIFRWMRVGTGGSYRFIIDSRTPGISNQQMSAPACHITLKLGKF